MYEYMQYSSPPPPPPPLALTFLNFSSDFATNLQILRPLSGVFYSFHGSREINIRGPQNMHDNVGNRLESVEFSSLHFNELSSRTNLHVLLRVFRQGWRRAGGGGEWLIKVSSWARMSSQRGPRSAECGIRVSAASGCQLRSAAGVRSAAGRCLRSRPMSAECGVRSTADYGVYTKFCSI